MREKKERSKERKTREKKGKVAVGQVPGKPHGTKPFSLGFLTLLFTPRGHESERRRERRGERKERRQERKTRGQSGAKIMGVL